MYVKRNGNTKLCHIILAHASDANMLKHKVCTYVGKGGGGGGGSVDNNGGIL